MSTTPTSTPQQKPFLTLMNEVKTKTPFEIQTELCKFFEAQRPAGMRCPVPGCTHSGKFYRWGDLHTHFVNDTHKKDFYSLYRDKYHRPYGAGGGDEFKYGVMALMLAQLKQPTSLEDAARLAPTRKTTTTTTTKVTTKTVEELVAGIPLRSKKSKKTEVQVPLPNLPEAPAEASEFTVTLAPAPPETAAPMVVESEPEASTQTRRNSGAFHKVAEIIRNSDEINLVWRGKMLEHFIEVFHGIPPCFHCRSAEGKQIHHQNPLFHEIVLLMLNKLGTTADKVLEAKEQGNEVALQTLLREVVAFHMKEGKVLAVPYCSDCNQDAEMRRKMGKRKGF